MTREPRPLATLAMVALASLLGMGCSGGSSADSGTGRTKTAAATTREKAVQFAECMRDNGIDEFPDPDASGELTIDGVLNGSSIDSDSATWTTAVAACKDLEPSGFTGHTRTTEEQSAALKFAQCIRDNGVRDFPDPLEGEPMIDTNRIPSAATEAGMDILHAAMQACRDKAAAAGVTGP